MITFDRDENINPTRRRSITLTLTQTLAPTLTQSLTVTQNVTQTVTHTLTQTLTLTLTLSVNLGLASGSIRFSSTMLAYRFSKTVESIDSHQGAKATNKICGWTVCILKSGIKVKDPMLFFHGFKKPLVRTVQRSMCVWIQEAAAAAGTAREPHRSWRSHLALTAEQRE